MSQMIDRNPYRRPAAPRSSAPWWYVVLIVLALSPLGSVPAMIGYCPSTDIGLRTYIWCYPIALVASAYYAWQCYRQRTLLAWIMLIFMYLIDAGMIYLCFFVGPSPL